MALENKLLNGQLGWNLTVITPLHAVESLLSMGIVFDSDEREDFEVPPILKNHETLHQSL